MSGQWGRDMVDGGGGDGCKLTRTGLVWVEFRFSFFQESIENAILAQKNGGRRKRSSSGSPFKQMNITSTNLNNIRRLEKFLCGDDKLIILDDFFLKLTQELD